MYVQEEMKIVRSTGLRDVQLQQRGIVKHDLEAQQKTKESVKEIERAGDGINKRRRRGAVNAAHNTIVFLLHLPRTAGTVSMVKVDMDLKPRIARGVCVSGKLWLIQLLLVESWW